jgi:hypothetical protein
LRRIKKPHVGIKVFDGPADPSRSLTFGDHPEARVVDRELPGVLPLYDNLDASAALAYMNYCSFVVVHSNTSFLNFLINMSCRVAPSFVASDPATSPLICFGF